MRVITFILILFCISSCKNCVYQTCDCFDDSDASMSINFNTDSTSLNYFTKKDLDSCIVIIFENTINGKIIKDTQNIGFNPDFKFAYFGMMNSEALSKNEYNSPFVYQIYNKKPLLNIIVDSIYIKGHKSGECLSCQCYKNELIYYNVNGVRYSKFSPYKIIKQ